MNGIYTEIYPLKLITMNQKLTPVALSIPEGDMQAATDKYLRPYKCLSLEWIPYNAGNGGCDIYEKENTVGEYNITINGTNNTFTITFPNEPTTSITSGITVQITCPTVDDGESPTANTLKLTSYTGNVVTMKTFNVTTNVLDPNFVSAFIEIKFYPTPSMKKSIRL